jgi:hypothetical protein
MPRILTLVLILYIVTANSETPKSSSSWLREKYLDEQYNHYYKYAVETDYEDRITCPEINKPAMLNAITGATQYTVTTLRRRIPPPPIAVSATTPETDPPLFQRFKTRNIYILDITIRDIVLFIIDILVIIAHWIYCIWQVVSMTVMLTMTIIVTWLVLVLFFGQY